MAYTVLGTEAVAIQCIPLKLVLNSNLAKSRLSISQTSNRSEISLGVQHKQCYVMAIFVIVSWNGKR